MFVLLVLHEADLLYRLLGRVVSLAIGRIMHIFIVAIGVNFMFRAAKIIFPVLAGSR